jgi:hypothetical protein
MLKIDGKQATPNQVAEAILVDNLDLFVANAIDHYVDYENSAYDGVPTKRERGLLISALRAKILKAYKLFGVSFVDNYLSLR